MAWYKVDNAAKVFLASHNGRDPRVFRVSCTLNESVDPELLNDALARTVRDLPGFQVTLHRGLFWHYFESTDKRPAVEPEDKPPCAAIFGRDQKNELLYRVSWYRNRINVEMFHALSDGNGGLVFLKSLVHNYLQRRHPDVLADVPREEGASAAEMTQDSFRKYYQNRPAAAQPDPDDRRKVYRLHAARLPYGQMQCFEAHLSAKQALALARGMKVSLTSYLGAQMMLAIYREMPALQRGRAVSISLPVNLRNYYPSDTARNFFNSIRVSHVFTGEETLEQLAQSFDAKLRRALTDEQVKARMDSYEKLERMPGVKPVPLFIKNPVVGAFARAENNRVSATISNMGRIPVLPAVQPYIKGFSAFCSTDALFTVVCSCGDDLVLGTTSAFRATSVLKNFYRALTDAGLDVTLYATEVMSE